MQLPLSTGEIVHLRMQYTHGMERSFKEALTKGMSLKERDGEVVVENITADALDRAVEAVLPLLVEKTTKDGQESSYSSDWLSGLPERDFVVLRDKVVFLREENESQKERGKKTR